MTGTESGGRLLSVTGAYLSQPSSAMRLSLSRSLQTEVADDRACRVTARTLDAREHCSNKQQHQQVLCDPHAVCAMQQKAAHRQHLLSFSSFSRSMSRLICSGSTSSSFFLQHAVLFRKHDRLWRGRHSLACSTYGWQPGEKLLAECAEVAGCTASISCPVQLPRLAGSNQAVPKPACWGISCLQWGQQAQPGHGGLSTTHLHASGRIAGGLYSLIQT